MQQSIFSKIAQEILVEIDNLARASNEDRVLASDLLSLIRKKDTSLVAIIDKFKVHHRKKIELTLLMEDCFQQSVLAGVLIIDSIHILLATYKQIDEKLYSQALSEIQKTIKTDKLNPPLEE